MRDCWILEADSERAEHEVRKVARERALAQRSEDAKAKDVADYAVDRVAARGAPRGCRAQEGDARALRGIESLVISACVVKDHSVRECSDAASASMERRSKMQRS
eukprot:1675058-Pleurochrysis_carterae.AAC.2